MKDGTPIYTYNYVGIDIYTATAKAKLPKGKSTVKLDFAHDGGDPGSGGTATLYIDGKSVGSTNVGQTEFSIFSADETASVDSDIDDRSFFFKLGVRLARLTAPIQ